MCPRQHDDVFKNIKSDVIARKTLQTKLCTFFVGNAGFHLKTHCIALLRNNKNFYGHAV